MKVAEKREALRNIKPGDVVVVRLDDDLGRVVVDRQASKKEKVPLAGKEYAILRYLYRGGRRVAPRPPLQAELKWPGVKRLYLLAPKGGDVPIAGVGRIGRRPDGERIRTHTTHALAHRLLPR